MSCESHADHRQSGIMERFFVRYPTDRGLISIENEFQTIFLQTIYD